MEHFNIVVKKLYSDKNKKDVHTIHTNDGHELYYLIQGDVSFSINGSVYKVVPSDVLVINNNELHKITVNHEVAHERIFIYFDPEYISQFKYKGYGLLKLFESRRKGFANRIHSKLVEEYKVRDYFEEIYRWSISDLAEKQVMMASTLLQLLVVMNTIYDQVGALEGAIEEDVEYNPKIHNIIEYITSNLHTKITLDDLEKRFYIDRYYLCHLFKDITGYSVIEYMNHKRILQAKEEIRQGKTVNQIWMHYGFMNYSSFYRTFKKYAAVSPNTYYKEFHCK